MTFAHLTGIISIMSTHQTFDGQFLIAMPDIGDPRFERTVIYMCAHTSEGAMGIAVNKPSGDLSFTGLLERLDILKSDEQIRLPAELRSRPVLVGGPVEPGRGFVLHSSDYYLPEGTMPINASIGLTATLDVLRAMALGEGPRHALLALGYAGWGPGQLEMEISQNGWLTCEADEDILFGVPHGERYPKALARLGVDLGNLSPDAGHA